MNNEIKHLADKLITCHSLSIDEYKALISGYDTEAFEYLKKEAVKLRHEIYGNKIFIRGLIEISNICKNDCYYCGIRRSNKNCERYRLTRDEILSCCENGYNLGFRSFVLQGGEDSYFSDEYLCELIKAIKNKYTDCAVTLSLGERSEESYKKLYDAGGDRYLLRHETADSSHYSKLHPDNMKLEKRLKCLKSLKSIGFQVGCGMMVGSPYQTADELASDLKYIEMFKPDMCGIGPFIPHSETVFAGCKSGDVELTCFLLAVIRIIRPEILLPATTALGTISDDGREKAILSSANVLMPNLSPADAREKYSLYNNKLHSGMESAEMLEFLKEKIKSIGYQIVCDRGDVIKGDKHGNI